MAVNIIKNEKDTFLDLRFDNGDQQRLEEVIKKWNFKDHQSFFRFIVSIMLVTEDEFLAIGKNGEATPIKPAPDYINVNN